MKLRKDIDSSSFRLEPTPAFKTHKMPDDGCLSFVFSRKCRADATAIQGLR
jgi:hypothetical protein